MKKHSFRTKYKNDQDTKKMNEYEKFIHDYNKEIYISATAEYRRIMSKSYFEKINAPISNIYELIMKEIMPKEEYVKGQTLPEGTKLGNFKRNIFVTENELNKIVEYIYKHKDQWHLFTYKLKEKNEWTKVTISHEVKLNRTITGLNGRLGAINFARDTKKELKKVIELLKNKLDIEKDKK